VDASKKVTNVPVRAVATATARPMKTMVNEFYILGVRLFLLMNTCYTKHHPSTVNRCTHQDVMVNVSTAGRRRDVTTQ
jgi:hypothetical protein